MREEGERSIPAGREDKGSRKGRSLWHSGIKKGAAWLYTCGSQTRACITPRVSASVGLGWGSGEADDTY